MVERKEESCFTCSVYRRFECPISIQDDSKIDKYVNTYKVNNPSHTV